MKTQGHFYDITAIWMHKDTDQIIAVRDVYGRGSFRDTLIKSQFSSLESPVWSYKEIEWKKLNMPRVPINKVMEQLNGYELIGFI